MAVTTNGLFAITIGAVIALCGANSQTRGFLRAASGVDADQPSNRLVESSKVEAKLREAFAASIGQGGSVPQVQFAAIEATLLHTFEALPKNDMGRLGPRAVRHIVHSYFAKEHGWMIKGLEPHGMSLNVSEMHEVSLLQDKAPALVEAMLEARELGRGLNLNDVVAMVLTLEKLILGESTSIIETVYKFKELAVAELIKEDVLHEVLVSYLLLFSQGSNTDLTNAQRQWKAIQYVYMEEGGKGAEMMAFERRSVLKYRHTRSQHKNESEPERYSFTDVEHIVADLARDYGKWQNGECQHMQDSLKRLDTIGSGSVSLRAFYEKPKDAEYEFTEPEAYLRQIGALDESVLGSPKVRIQNYVLGPSNCIASSVYYSVCCLNECEGLMNRIEDAIEAPEATPEQLRSIVAELSTTELKGHLRDRLESIAAQGEGKVSLHGRLFAEWLHHAFPYECPYPAVVGADVLLPSPWTIENSTAAPEERRQHIEASRDSSSDASGDRSDCAPQWSDEEILPVHETQMPRRSAIGGFLRSLMQGLAFLVVLRVALGALQSAMHVHQGAKSDKGTVLQSYC